MTVLANWFTFVVGLTFTVAESHPIPQSCIKLISISNATVFDHRSSFFISLWMDHDRSTMQKTDNYRCGTDSECRLFPINHSEYFCFDSMKRSLTHQLSIAINDNCIQFNCISVPITIDSDLSSMNTYQSFSKAFSQNSILTFDIYRTNQSLLTNHSFRAIHKVNNDKSALITNAIHSHTRSLLNDETDTNAIADNREMEPIILTTQISDDSSAAHSHQIKVHFTVVVLAVIIAISVCVLCGCSILCFLGFVYLKKKLNISAQSEPIQSNIGSVEPIVMLPIEEIVSPEKVEIESIAPPIDLIDLEDDSSENKEDLQSEVVAQSIAKALNAANDNISERKEGESVSSIVVGTNIGSKTVIVFPSEIDLEWSAIEQIKHSHRNTITVVEKSPFNLLQMHSEENSDDTDMESMYASIEKDDNDDANEPIEMTPAYHVNFVSLLEQPRNTANGETRS